MYSNLSTRHMGLVKCGASPLNHSSIYRPAHRTYSILSRSLGSSSIANRTPFSRSSIRISYFTAYYIIISLLKCIMCLVALSKIYCEERKGGHRSSAQQCHTLDNKRCVVYIISYTGYTNNELTQQTNTLK